MIPGIPTRLLTVFALSGLLLAACGDVSVTGVYPGIHYAGNWWWWTGSPEFVASSTLSMQEPVDDALRVRVQARDGSVTVIGQPDPGSVHLTATLSVGSGTQDDALEGLDRLGIIVTRSDEEILVQTDQPAPLDGRQYVVDFTLAVPAELEVLVTQTNGQVTVEGINSLVYVQQANGAVQLLDIGADAIVQVHNGHIDGAVTLPPGGQISFSAVNGDIDLRLPASTSATVSAFAGNGTITWAGLSLGDVYRADGWLTGVLGAGNGAIELQTGNGDVSLGTVLK